uniref:7 transmembrane receptor (Rhodopsin family) C n=1 Tax=Philodina roseola TaxID=96448 RepID=B2L3H9_PHIRO|nr:7 transmembrane receptor (rhodopsin family) C [Philodina roseola]
MSTTQSAIEASISLQDYYLPAAFSGVISLIAISISIMILILVRRSKPRLHTVRHLLICNTSIASILYCISQSLNYVFLIFLRSDTSDMSCRIRGYISYLSMCAVIYSFLIQSVSRLFISLYSSSHKWLTTFRAHYVLILIQWIAVILIPLPALVTTDIRYRPTSMCFVALRFFAHVVYTYVAYYTIPALTICLIYVYIFIRVKKASRRAQITIRSTNSSKRDLEVLRNIFIYLIIYLSGGIPSILFLLTTNRIIFLISMVTISLAVAIEKVMTLLMDRDMRQIMMGLLRIRTRIGPMENSLTAARIVDNLYTIQQTK